MSRNRLVALCVIAAALIAITATVVVRSRRWRPRAFVLQGAVVRKDKDSRRRLPVAGATITATDGVITQSAQSDSSGYFNLRLNENLWPRQSLNLHIEAADYEPLDMQISPGLRLASEKLYVTELTSKALEEESAPGRKATSVTNLRVRYTVNTRGDENIGSAVQTFQVVNQGNVPCNKQAPCSPDGNWKAATGQITLDAGAGNGFRNVRASCIAGPCPFTRIDPGGFERGGQIITAKALDWSDTATFLVQAEVFREQINSSVRESYPVIFGRALNFVLPATEEGLSLEADLDGQPMVFPLGPELYLSWATCTARPSRDSSSSMVYRCELKPGYRF